MARGSKLSVADCGGRMNKMAYKIRKTKEFEEQEKKLNKADKKILSEVIKEISEHPENIKRSMMVFGLPSPEELAQWMDGTDVSEVDCVLEYLSDKDCLNKAGKKLARAFWEKYIHKG